MTQPQTPSGDSPGVNNEHVYPLTNKTWVAALIDYAPEVAEICVWVNDAIVSSTPDGLSAACAFLPLAVKVLAGAYAAHHSHCP